MAGAVVWQMRISRLHLQLAQADERSTRGKTESVNCWHSSEAVRQWPPGMPPGVPPILVMLEVWADAEEEVRVCVQASRPVGTGGLSTGTGAGTGTGVHVWSA